MAVNESRQIFIWMGMWYVIGYMHSSLAVKYTVISAEQIVINVMILIYVCNLLCSSIVIAVYHDSFREV